MPTTVSSTSPSGRALLSGAAVATVAALAGNLAVYAIGGVGAPIMVVVGSTPEPTELTMVELVATTVVAIAAGATLRWALSRTRFAGFRVWATIAAAVAVLSAVPLWRLDIDTASKVSLTTMHLWTGVAFIAVYWVLATGSRVTEQFRSAKRRRQEDERLAVADA